MRKAHLETSAAWPVLVGTAVGVIVGTASCFLITWEAAPLVGWDVAAVVFLALTWSSIGGMSATETSKVATKDDPSTAVTDLVIIGAGLASLGAVGLVLFKAGHSSGGTKAMLIAIGVISVAVSWAALHTMFTLKYARLFYSDKEPGIDFHDDRKPAYFDFAYVAFTVGMTFQVSDTDMTSASIRRSVLQHAMLSFLFGAVILGLTINVVASLLH